MLLDLSSCTRNAQKRRRFEEDPFLRDALDQFRRVSPGRLETLLFASVPVLFRPDALITGQYRDILSMLQDHGLTPRLALPFRYDRMLVRECWRYQLNIATRQRIDVMDALLVGQPAVYALFGHQDHRREDGPLCQRVSRLKGPSDPTRREPGQLRFSTRNAQVSVLTFVHVPDEPLDLLRELGAFFGVADRWRILRSACRSLGTADEFLKVFEGACAGLGQHDLRTETAWSNIVAGASGAGRTLAIGLRDAWETGDRRQWPRLLGRLKAIGTTAGHWDFAAIAAASATTHYSDGVPVVADLL